jgi:hypothetical protein
MKDEKLLQYVDSNTNGEDIGMNFLIKCYSSMEPIAIKLDKMPFFEQLPENDGLSDHKVNGKSVWDMQRSDIVRWMLKHYQHGCSGQKHPARHIYFMKVGSCPDKCWNAITDIIPQAIPLDLQSTQMSDISVNFDFSNSIIVDRQRLNQIGEQLYKSRQNGRSSKSVGGYMMADITNSFDKQYLVHFDFVLRQHHYHPLKGMSRKQPIQALSSIACPSTKTPEFVYEHYPLGTKPYIGDSPGGTWWIHPQSPTTIKNIVATIETHNPMNKRETLCSFKGSFQSHTGRGKMNEFFKTVGKGLNCKIINTGSFASGDPKEYSALVEDTIFTLCPRGTGKETMRLMDALMLGSIPVVIYEPYLDMWPVTPPVIIVKSWQEAIKKIAHLKDNTSLLEKMQSEGQTWLHHETQCQKKSMQALIEWSKMLAWSKRLQK